MDTRMLLSPWTLAGAAGAVFVVLALGFALQGGVGADEGEEFSYPSPAPAAEGSEAGGGGNLPVIIELERDEDFERLSLQSDLPVVLDFWAPWCPPCRSQTRVFKELAPELEGKARVLKINVDEHPEIADRFRVQAIPALFLAREGEITQFRPGLKDAQFLREKLGL